MNKYVISEDLDIALGSWCIKQNFSLPDIDFFDGLRQEMRDFFDDIFGHSSTDMVSAKELSCGVAELVERANAFPLSIDKIYFPTRLALEVNRMVNLSLNDNGLGPRFGFEPIQTQIEKIAKSCPSEIVLIDDVIFSGNGILEIIKLLNNYNIQVRSVIVGIAIGNGLTLLKQNGIKVKCVRFYYQVVDEVCERDFYPGAPMSGRSVIGMNANTGASYLLPFGKPAEWASIPKEKIKEFSIFCLDQTVKLWQKIEELSGKYMLITDLARWPFGITDKSIRIIEALKKAKEVI